MQRTDLYRCRMWSVSLQDGSPCVQYYPTPLTMSQMRKLLSSQACSQGNCASKCKTGTVSCNCAGSFITINNATNKEAILAGAPITSSGLSTAKVRSQKTQTRLVMRSAQILHLQRAAGIAPLGNVAAARDLLL